MSFSQSNQNMLLNAARGYVEHVLQTALLIEGPVNSSNLPAFLMQRYELVAGQILRHQCILMLAANEQEDTPATVAKHRDVLQRHFPTQTIILVADRVSNHNRHRLISQRVPFIIPGNQLFVPELAMDLREHFRAERERPADSLTPTAQLVVVAALTGKIGEMTPSELASRFRYSVMSMSRTIGELEALQLVDVEPSGRFRRASFTLPREDLWERARPLLRSPVRKRRRVRRPPNDSDMPLAGESALAEWTDLSHPRLETRAIAASDWKSLATRYNLDRPLSWDEPEIELETWSYDPMLLGNDHLVDPISLWLSLPESADDRRGAARDDLLRQVGL